MKEELQIIKLLQDQNVLLRKQNDMMKKSLCKCPHDGVLVNCPIHGIDGIDRRYF